VPGAHVTVINGDQFTGRGGISGNQLQDGSVVRVRPRGGGAWDTVQLELLRETGNEKFYAARLQVPETAAPGAGVEHDPRIAHSDRDTTFVHAGGAAGSTTTGDETTVQAAPFRSTLGSPAQSGRCGRSSRGGTSPSTPPCCSTAWC